MTIPTEEEYQQALAVKAEYERVQQEILALKRNHYFDTLSPIVNGADFSTLRSTLIAIHDQTDAEAFFSAHLENVLATMAYLSNAISHYTPYVPADPAPQNDPGA